MATAMIIKFVRNLCETTHANDVNEKEEIFPVVKLASFVFLPFIFSFHGNA